MVYVDEHIYGFDLDAALRSISEQRREQALRYRYELGQRQCVLAYLLLKRALHDEYGIDGNPVFSYGEHGKPFLTDYPGIHFSLSHCREAVACAVSTKPVGIDVESVREYKEGLARYTMSDDELQQILSADRPDVAFTRLWTMKEAVLKMAGTGITNDIKTVLAGASCQFTVVERLSQGYVYAFTS